MLQHETVSEITPLPVIPRQAAPPEPEELARAVVALESSSENTARSEAKVTPQTLAACGVDITAGEHLSTAKLTTSDAYDSVWWYYANLPFARSRKTKS